MDSPPLSERPSTQETTLRPALMPRYPLRCTAAFLRCFSHVRREATAESATARASGNGMSAAQSRTVSSGVVSLTPPTQRAARAILCFWITSDLLLPEREMTCIFARKEYVTLSPYIDAAETCENTQSAFFSASARMIARDLAAGSSVAQKDARTYSPSTGLSSRPSSQSRARRRASAGPLEIRQRPRPSSCSKRAASSDPILRRLPTARLPSPKLARRLQHQAAS